MNTVWIGMLVLLVILAGIGYYYFSSSFQSQQLKQQDVESQIDQLLEKELEESLSSVSTSDLETALSQTS